jgi:hypothetical protein
VSTPLAVGDEITVGGVCPNGIIDEAVREPGQLQHWLIREMPPCGCYLLTMKAGQTPNVEFNNACGLFLIRHNDCRLRHR